MINYVFNPIKSLKINKETRGDVYASLVELGVSIELFERVENSVNLTVNVFAVYVKKDGEDILVPNTYVLANKTGIPFLYVGVIPSRPWTLGDLMEYQAFDSQAVAPVHYLNCECIVGEEKGLVSSLEKALAEGDGYDDIWTMYVNSLEFPDEKEEPVETANSAPDVLKAESPVDRREEEDEMLEGLKRYFSAPHKKGDKVTTFMNKEGKYTMYEYASLIRKNCTVQEWKSIEPFLNLSADTCAVLGDLNTRFNLFDVLLEMNTEFTEASKKIADEGYKMDARTIQSLGDADHVASRYPQASNQGEVYLTVNRTCREGDLVAYMNIFDQDCKIAYAASSKQPVQYAVTLARGTKTFTRWAVSINSSYAELVPTTPYLEGDYSDADFSVLSDVAVSVKKHDKGRIRMIWNTKGGSMFSDKEELTAYHKVGPFGRMLGEGVPDVFKLFYAYQYDARFSDAWDNKVKQATVDRQAKRDKSVLANWQAANQMFFETWAINKLGILMQESPGETTTAGSYDEQVDLLHQFNRSMVETISVDRSAFMRLIYQFNHFGSELLPITMLNDLFFDGMVADLRYAHDLVSTVYVERSDNYGRPLCHPKDKVTYDNLYNDKFDLKPRSGRRCVIDLTDASLDPIFIGGGNWTDKIRRNENETRAELYYDYEPGLGVVVNGKHVPERVNSRDDAQYQHANKVLSVLKDVNSTIDKVGVVTSVRMLPRILKDYNVCYICPAPFPMTMSVYVLASRAAPKRRVDLDNARDLVNVLYWKIRLIIETYMYGAGDIRGILDDQMSVESGPMKALFAAWWKLMGDRYKRDLSEMERKGTSGKRIKCNLEKMLRVDEGKIMKGVIKGSGERMDIHKNSFIVKRRTLQAVASADQQQQIMTPVGKK